MQKHSKKSRYQSPKKKTKCGTKTYHALQTTGYQSQTRFLDDFFHVNFNKTSTLRWYQACHTEPTFLFRQPDFNSKFALSDFFGTANLTNYRRYGVIWKRMQIRKVSQKKLLNEGTVVPNVCFGFEPPCPR